MRVLIVGVGYVGAALAGDLAQLGHETFGLSRSVRPLPAGVTPLQADAAEPSSLERLRVEPDQVVCCLAAAGRSASAYQASYLAAVRNLLARFAAARLIFVSSTAVYDQTNGEVVQDDTPKHATTETSRVLSAAEDLLLGRGHVVVRPSGIYGPGRTRLMSKLSREELSLAEADCFTNRIHQLDLRRVLSFLIERPELEGSFLASDREPTRLASLRTWVRAQLGLSEGQLSEGQLLAQPPGSPEGGSERRSRQFLPTRLLSLGFDFRYPTFREGYGELLEEIRASAARGPSAPEPSRLR